MLFVCLLVWSARPHVIFELLGYHTAHVCHTDIPIILSLGDMYIVKRSFGQVHLEMASRSSVLDL